MMARDLAIEAVIFDMDGLMFDTELVARTAWKRAMADWGYELPEPLYFSVVGKAAPDVQAIFLKSLGRDMPIADITERKCLYMEEELASGGIPLKPGLIDLLDHLDELGISKAVASSTVRRTVDDWLRRAGIAHRFDVVIGGDEVERSKPEPDLFLAASLKLHIPAEKCLVLEDSEAGIRAAHAASMVPVMVPDLKPPSDEIIPLACRIVSSLEEVIALL